MLYFIIFTGDISPRHICRWGGLSAQKRLKDLQSKMEKVNITTEFCIFELVLVPCQLKLTILIFGSKFVQKRCFQSIAL